ncbi:MAG TPA: hypothetical protein VIJ71_10440, partial [Mycobacteriales bacterium]
MTGHQPSDVLAAAVEAAAGPYIALAPPGSDERVMESLLRVLAREPSVGAVGLGSSGLQDVLAVPAGPCAIRAAALEQTGGLSPLFDEYEALGRLDLGWRLRAGGWRVCTGIPGDVTPQRFTSAEQDPRAAALRLAVLHRNLGPS